jgi:threonine/homoserine/homoserine lactone efflux protein
MHQTLFIFAAVTFVGVATPGPDVLLSLANGSRFGIRLSLLGLLGVLLADLVLIAAVALGLGTLLAASEFWFSLVKWAGVAYLAHLGFQMLRSAGTIAAPTPDTQPSSGRPVGWSVFSRSFLIAATNPKGYFFFSAVLPQFVALSQPLLPQYAALTVVFVVVESVIMLAYAVAGAQAIRLLGMRGVRWVERTCGAAMVALAASLAMYRRST